VKFCGVRDEMSMSSDSTSCLFYFIYATLSLEHGSTAALDMFLPPNSNKKMKFEKHY
jgi:hypothetical protein